MKLTEKEKKIYDTIDFYNRYEKLSKEYQFEDCFENYSNEKVMDIIEQMGYKVRYFKKESFFQVKEKSNNLKFNFHICLKYGNVELIMGQTNTDTNEKIGNVFTMIIKRIEISENIEKEGYMKDPKFRNYDDLKEILKDAFSIYEDFKKEVVG